MEAGYSERTAYSQGSRLLRNVEVRAELERHRSRAEEQSQVTLRWVLDQLVQTYEEARSAERYGPAVTCLALLGKHLGLFDKRPEPILTDVERADRLRALLGLGDSTTA